ncbi:MAG: arsenic efflux protein [Bacilli bacterium]|nr:arsenic efflux protein [Bacilli bacterium]
MLDIILDTLIDGLKLIPFLFVAFLIIEAIEHKLSKKNKNVISKAGKFGPLAGGVLGALPQCGFSVMATNLYATRIITLGTLISIYLSTSDEMLPIMLSHKTATSLIIKVILTKVVIGIIYGFIIDFILRKKVVKKETKKFDMCNEEHCDCSHGILKSSIKHTLTTTLFILATTLILNTLMEVFGENLLSKILLKNTVFGSFITSLISLIPNCGSSVVVTELYLKNAITYGSMIGGLLTGSGVGLLILFRVNKNIKENINIVTLVYFLGAITGILIDLFLMLK